MIVARNSEWTIQVRGARVREATEDRQALLYHKDAAQGNQGKKWPSICNALITGFAMKPEPVEVAEDSELEKVEKR